MVDGNRKDYNKIIENALKINDGVIKDKSKCFVCNKNFTWEGNLDGSIAETEITILGCNDINIIGDPNSHVRILKADIYTRCPNCKSKNRVEKNVDIAYIR